MGLNIGETPHEGIFTFELSHSLSWMSLQKKEASNLLFPKLAAVIL